MVKVQANQRSAVERKTVSELILDSVNDLASVKTSNATLGIMPRKCPDGFDLIAEQLCSSSFRIHEIIPGKDCYSAISDLLRHALKRPLDHEPLYQYWLDDMAYISECFAIMLGTDTLAFCLGTERGCARYHVDNVPQRLLVTYAGTGTEWLPEAAADRQAWANGEPNDRILLDPAKRQFLTPWDVAVFKGGKDGILHRTPDDALAGKSLLMRLDHPGFLAGNAFTHENSAHTPHQAKKPALVGN